nr:adenosylcobinamide-GDP ribazoletransferase [Mesorhizobium sp.]
MSRSGLDPRDVLADVVACVGFYTRIPVPRSVPLPASFAAAQWAAPLAGLIVGLAGALAMCAALWLGLPATVAAVIALAATMLVTGALHEDGAADVGDGLGGGSTRERKLEIMRDSRVGAYGVCVLGVSLLARWSALAALAAAGGWMVAIALIAAHAAARAPIPAFMAIVAPARLDGLSAGAGRPGQETSIAALVLGALVLLLGGPAFALASAVVLALWFLALRRLAERQIGGQTGDVLGALEQGGEALILMSACVFLL